MAFEHQCSALLAQIINNNVPVYLTAEELVIGRFHFIFLRY